MGSLKQIACLPGGSPGRPRKHLTRLAAAVQKGGKQLWTRKGRGYFPFSLNTYPLTVTLG